MTFSRQVYLLLKKVPAGKVVSYGQIADACGRPGAARAVGNVLNRNPQPGVFPCHRVIRANGHIGGFMLGIDKKSEILRKEGVKVSKKGFIDFEEFGFDFEI
ncbi:MAG: MGMT family protein [Candidatus Moraniibacteriota bacterium]